jgi:hypothetical protein
MPGITKKVRSLTGSFCDADAFGLGKELRIKRDLAVAPVPEHFALVANRVRHKKRNSLGPYVKSANVTCVDSSTAFSGEIAAVARNHTAR